MKLNFLNSERNQGSRAKRGVLKYWLPVIAWMGLIFYLSHQPDLKSGLEDWLDFVLRKIAHITEYGILTFLLLRATHNKKRALLIAALVAFLYAISDEYHQTFIFGRHGTARDVGIDTLGILIATWLSQRFFGKFLVR